MFGASRAQLEYRPLPSVEIIDHDVDVHLLRNGLAWPLRWAVLLDALEADALVAGGVAHLAPPVVRTGLPIEQSAIELGEATGVRYRPDAYLADMDAGFYSADYLRAWIRSAQLRDHLKDEIGPEWWRSAETGERLRALFSEGTRPSSEEVAARIGFDPLDTEPLVSELRA